MIVLHFGGIIDEMRLQKPIDLHVEAQVDIQLIINEIVNILHQNDHHVTISTNNDPTTCYITHFHGQPLLSLDMRKSAEVRPIIEYFTLGSTIYLKLHL